MCIIIAKNKLDRLPTREELTNCFERNSDGAGFMYVEMGRVKIEKGFMTLDKFLKHYDKLCRRFNNFKNKSLVIHCRIGTASGNTAQNTHPYPIVNNENDLHKLTFTTDLGVAHNGVIYDYNPIGANPTTNDTQNFIMEYLNPLYENFKTFYKNTNILNGLKKITNSKLAFLDKDDNLYLVGDFVEEDKLKFSNTTYKKYQYTYKTYNWNSKNDNYWNKKDYKYDDYSYDDMWGTKDDFDIDEKNILDLPKGAYILPCDSTSYYQVRSSALKYDTSNGNVYSYNEYSKKYKLFYEDCSLFDENWTLLY